MALLNLKNDFTIFRESFSAQPKVFFRRRLLAQAEKLWEFEEKSEVLGGIGTKFDEEFFAVEAATREVHLNITTGSVACKK